MFGKRKLHPEKLYDRSWELIWGPKNNYFDWSKNIIISCGQIAYPQNSVTEVVTWATPVSGTGISGGGSGYAALLAHAE